PRPEERDIADYLQAHLVLVQPLGFLLQGSHEQLLQRPNLFGGSPPVLRAEGEQGQVFDSAIGARTRDLTHRLDPLLVTGDAREIALFGPAPVAIHDDGDMPGDVVGGRDLARRASEGFHVWIFSGVRSDRRLAFSITPGIFFSQGDTPRVLASRRLTLATFGIGIWLP